MKLSARIAMVLAVAQAGAAWAYVPPTEYLVGKIARARQGTGAIWVKSKVSPVADGQTVADGTFYDISIFDPRNQMMTCLAVDADNKVLFAKKTFLQAGTEPAQAVPASMAALPAYLLFGESPKDLVNALLKAGLAINVEPENPEPFKFLAEMAANPPPPAPTKDGEAPAGPDPLPLLDRMPKPLLEDTAIRRWNDTIAWVISRDGRRVSATPQLWIEKDTYLPVRLVLSSGEVQFKTFRYAKSHPYPATATLVEGTDPVLVAEMMKIVTEPELKDRPKILREGYTELGQSASGRVRASIDKYYAELR